MPRMQPLSDVVVVLVRTQGPINLGMIARLCANLGVEQLRLVGPLCDPASDDARKFAVVVRDDILATAPVFASLAAATADRQLVLGTSGRGRDDQHGAPMTPPQAVALAAERGAQKVALVFGNEADGLNDDELRACNAYIHLETPGSHASYNLSHAVAITGYLWAQHASANAPSAAEPAAVRADVERLGRYWLGTLERFRYFRRTPLEQWRPQFESMLNRMQLTDHDLVVVRGMLAQMNYVAFGDKAEDMDRSGRAPDSAAES
jgi:tRNA/rRNA methyltransferase